MTFKQDTCLPDARHTAAPSAFIAMASALAFVLICSCNKNPLMIKAKALPIPHLDKAVVTFIRSSVMAPTAKSGLWDRETFIGEIKVRSYIQYEATPGKHLFLASGETWSYIEANLQGGRNYIIRVTAMPGGTAPRMDLEPLAPGGRTTAEDIDDWLENLDGYKPSKKVADEYRKTHLNSVKAAIKRYDDGRIACETLEPDDAW